MCPGLGRKVGVERPVVPDAITMELETDAAPPDPVKEISSAARRLVGLSLDGSTSRLAARRSFGAVAAAEADEVFGDGGHRPPAVAAARTAQHQSHPPEPNGSSCAEVGTFAPAPPASSFPFPLRALACGLSAGEEASELEPFA